MRAKALLLLPFLTATAFAAEPEPTIEGALGSSPVSCFYMMMHAYRDQLAVCEVPLDEAREERFSRMSAAMEDYILENATLDPVAIIDNARGSAEWMRQMVPACGTPAFEETREAMLNLTTAESEALLRDQLATNGLQANGSCYVPR